MALRSAACAVLLAIPVAVAAQISFSTGIGNVPLSLSTFADGPEASAIGTSRGAGAPAQNLAELLTPESTPSGAATAGVDGGIVPTVAGDGGPTIAGNDPGTLGPGPTTPQGPGGEGPGGEGPGVDPTPPGPNPTPTPPPVPPPGGPGGTGTSSPPPVAVGPVNVPDVGNVVDSVTAPSGQAPNLPGLGGLGGTP